MLKQNKTLAPFIKSQLGRACLSIMLNVAEGSAKFSDRDRRNYLITARGSAFECSAIVSLLYDEGEINEATKTQFYDSFNELSRILYVMIGNLNKKIAS